MSMKADKAEVLARYPDAFVRMIPEGYPWRAINSPTIVGDDISNVHKTDEDAWADAAASLNSKPDGLEK